MNALWQSARLRLALLLERGIISQEREDAIFRAEYKLLGLKHAAVASVVGAATFLVFLIGDHYSIPVGGDFQLVRVVLSALLFAAALLFARSPIWVLGYYEIIVGGLVSCVSIAIVVVGTMATQHPLSGPMKIATGLMFAQFLTYGLLRLEHMTAFLVGAIPVLLLVFLSVGYQGYTSELASSTVSLLASNLIGTYLNISAHRRERDLYLARMRAVSRVQQKTKLVGSLAHDIRGPLMATALTIGRISRQDNSSIAAAIERANYAAKEVEHLREYAEHLLRLCKDEMDAYEATVDKIELSAAMGRVLPSIESLACQLGVDFKFVNRCGKRTSIVTSISELQAILLNIAENALKYGGSPRSAHQKVAMECRVVDNRVQIRIADSGDGLPSKTGELLQSHNVIAECAGHAASSAVGTGLGLTIVRERMSRLPTHRLEAHATPGSGTTFILEVPLGTV